MSTALLGGYLLVVAVLVLIPGPDVLLVLRSAIADGARGGLAAGAGVCAASVLQGTAAVLGLGALIVRSQTAFEVIRWAGVAYLTFLGVQALRAAWRGGDATAVEAAPRASVGRRLTEGFLCNITNPKILVMYLSVLPQFVGPSTPLGAGLLLAYLVPIAGGLWFLVLLTVVGRARAWLTRRRVRRSLDAIGGTALLGFGVGLALR